MNSKIWMTIGTLTIVAGLIAAAVSALRAFNSPQYGTADGLPATLANLDAAIIAGAFVGVGFIFIALGLIKLIKEKKLKESSD